MFREAPICSLDRSSAMKRTICFSRSVKGPVTTFTSSKAGDAIGGPFTRRCRACRCLHIWNGSPLTVDDYVRPLTVLLTVSWFIFGMWGNNADDRRANSEVEDSGYLPAKAFQKDWLSVRRRDLPVSLPLFEASRRGLLRQQRTQSGRDRGENRHRYW